MRAAAAAEEFEQATLERNRLRAVRSLLGAPARRRTSRSARSTRWPSRSTGATPTRRSSRCATACSPTASPSTCPTRPSASVAEVAEEFMLQYYGGHTVDPGAARGAARARRAPGARGRAREPPRRPGRAARGRARREAAHPRAGRAQRAASRSTRSGCAPSAAARAASRRWKGCSRRSASTCRRSASSASTSPTSAARTRSPRWSCSRAARRRSPTTAASRSARSARGSSDDFAAMAEVLGRRFAQWERQADLSPHDPAYDASFASLPNLVVIDGGKGQLAAGLGPLRGFRERGVAVVSLGQADRGGVRPGPPLAARARPLHARAAAAAARARRGAPLRDHPPPQPARHGDDELAARRAAGRRPGAQARAARALRLARRGRLGLARGAAGGAGAAREGRRASCTPTCTAPAEPRSAEARLPASSAAN